MSVLAIKNFGLFREHFENCLTIKVVEQSEVDSYIEKKQLDVLVANIKLWAKSTGIRSVIIPVDSKLINALTEIQVIVKLVIPSSAPIGFSLNEYQGNAFIDIEVIDKPVLLDVVLLKPKQYTSLLSRTKEALTDNKLGPDDVMYFTTPDGRQICTWREFENLADFHSPINVEQYADAVGLKCVLTNNAGYLQLNSQGKWEYNPIPGFKHPGKLNALRKQIFKG